jgi:TatD DNase family protein
VIDSHAHLVMFEESERDEVLARAAAVGVRTVLVPATGAGDLGEVAELGGRWPGRVVAAVGFHPHEARLLDDEARRRLGQAAGRAGVVAIGEIGLDYHYDHSPREDQARAFAWQLDLARERDLPVVLHHREAWHDFLRLLDGAGGVRGVAHSFTEGDEGARQVIARGLHVGISGMVTFPKADNVRAAARAVPAGRLLVETDSPYLAPVPHRGRRNEPAWVTRGAAAVARVREVAPEQLERETDATFEALFLRRGDDPAAG